MENSFLDVTNRLIIIFWLTKFCITFSDALEDEIIQLKVSQGVVDQKFDEVKESLEENFDSLQQETNGKFGRTIYIFNIKLTQSMAIGQSQSEKKYY